MRLVYVVRDQELRLGSAVIRGFDFSDEVVVISLTDNESERTIAEAAGATYISHRGRADAPLLARTLVDSIPESDEKYTVAIGIDADWQLKDLPMHIALARTRNDIYIAFKHRSANQRVEEELDESEKLTITSYRYKDAAISVCALSPKGLRELAAADPEGRPADLPRDLQVRIIELDAPPLGKQRESLASASRYAQLFYWMLESKHPLVTLGIPGILFFTVGYQMATALIDIGGPHDTVSIGVALVAFAVTFIGVLSLVSGLVLYILGKQIDKMQLEYQ